MILFISFCTKPQVAAKKAVVAPTNVITNNTGDCREYQGRAPLAHGSRRFYFDGRARYNYLVESS